MIAKHGTETLAAELEARSENPGEHADQLYGRLLRRVVDYPDAHVVGVVPERMRWHASRVPHSLRELLHLDIYLVDDFQAVHRLRPPHDGTFTGIEGLARVLEALQSVRPDTRDLGAAE